MGITKIDSYIGIWTFHLMYNSNIFVTQKNKKTLALIMKLSSSRRSNLFLVFAFYQVKKYTREQNLHEVL